MTRRRPAAGPDSNEALPLQHADRHVGAFSQTIRIGLLTLVLALGVARAASAQGTGGTLGTTTTFTSDDFAVVVQESPGAAFPDFDLQRFFNVANCQCKVPVYLFFTLSSSGFQKKAGLPEGSIEFWAGLGCNDITTGLREGRCTRLHLQGSSAYSMVLSAFATAGGVVIPSDTQVLSQNFGQPSTVTTGGGGVTGTTGTAGPSGDAACTTGLAFSQNIWALVTFSGSTTYDVAATLAVNVDLAPPPPPDPTSISVTGGNEAVVVKWTGIDVATTPDILGYQVLCDRAGSLQVFKNGAYGEGFATCATNTLTGLDAQVRALDPNFICSPLLSALSTSYRVKILQNGITYGVGLISIDTHHNASAPFLFYGSPVKTLSFYDVYRNGDSANTMPGDAPDPGRASGGYCAVGGGAGTHRLGAGGAVALVVGLALVVVRRRRGRRS
jgi:hypothetical protein